ncbi:MAG: YkgJ family cysteine cluster protein [Pseudomonadota bacterium]
MNNTRQEVLQIIYHKFDEWLQKEKFFCHKGCSACCTNNVMATKLEAESIIDHIVGEGKIPWFAEKLEQSEGAGIITRTTNGFARICLEKEEETDDAGEESWSLGSCPFLEGDTCGIYQVRPFACRSFASLTDCRTYGTSTLPEGIVAGNTVSMQVIEHLGQGEMWGNIIDLLLALCGEDQYSGILNHLKKKERINEAKTKLLPAEAIPGFLLMPDEEKEVEALLWTIYSEKIGQKSVGDFF